ncbi:hypothetical protein [Nocardia sp. NPDC049707]|uniref:hypothetical protein n=1 Tax=Nocardia sp. NPDC049707 TaxID=3154735 RepID=UPI00343BC148
MRFVPFGLLPRTDSRAAHVVWVGMLVRIDLRGAHLANSCVACELGCEDAVLVG